MSEVVSRSLDKAARLKENCKCLSDWGGSNIVIAHTTKTKKKNNKNMLTLENILQSHVGQAEQLYSAMAWSVHISSEHNALPAALQFSIPRVNSRFLKDKNS